MSARGYTYADDRRHTVYFDPEYKALSTALGKALPNLPIVTFVNASHDGNKILLFAGSDSDAGRYYLFDKTTKKLGEVLPARPGLAARTLASVQSVTYPAADGASVPAYLTLQRGARADAVEDRDVARTNDRALIARPMKRRRAAPA